LQSIRSSERGGLQVSKDRKGRPKALDDHEEFSEPRLPMRIVQAGRIELALQEFWMEELGVSWDFARTHFSQGERSECSEVTDISLYPGLLSVRHIHVLPFQLRDGCFQACAKLGLPEGSTFHVEAPAWQQGSKAKAHKFCWVRQHQSCL